MQKLPDYELPVRAECLQKPDAMERSALPRLTMTEWGLEVPLL
jgi:hypothetical protein